MKEQKLKIIRYVNQCFFIEKIVNIRNERKRVSKAELILNKRNIKSKNSLLKMDTYH